VDLEPDDAVMGEWDLEAIRRLFTSLEFRTLFERLEEAGRSAKPAVEVAELDLRRVDVAEAVELVVADGPKALRLDLEGREVRGIAVSMGGGQAAYAEAGDLGAFAGALADDAVATWLHDAKDFETAVVAEGRSLAGVRTDTMLSAYLLLTVLAVGIWHESAVRVSIACSSHAGATDAGATLNSDVTFFQSSVESRAVAVYYVSASDPSSLEF